MWNDIRTYQFFKYMLGLPLCGIMYLVNVQMWLFNVLYALYIFFIIIYMWLFLFLLKKKNQKPIVECSSFIS